MGRRRTNPDEVEFLDTPFRKPYRVSKRRVALALWATTLAVPIMIFDNLPGGGELADVAMGDTPAVVESTVRSTTTTAAPTTTTEAPATTTAPPSTTSTVKATTSTTAKPTTTTKKPTTTTTAPARQAALAAPTTTTAKRPTPVVSDGTTVQNAIAQYFPDQFEYALKVARCESGLNPNAVGGTGGRHFGLFQISSVHEARVKSMGYSWDQILDPYVNSHVARSIVNEQGWKPWSCAR